MPHYEILSPLEAPVTYLLFAITWISCIVCVVISVSFYQTRREGWWLVVALAMALPLILEVGMALGHGLPPLPYELRYPPQTITDSEAHPYKPLAGTDSEPGTRGTTVLEYSVSRFQWSFYPPLMAIALVWAYRKR